MTNTTESPRADVMPPPLPQASGSGAFYTAEPQAGRPSGSPDGHVPRGASVRVAGSAPPPISMIDDGRGCTMPADIGRDQCAACWRPNRSGAKTIPAAHVTLHSGVEVECMDRVARKLESKE
jgi:hypothetical protein